MEFRRKITKEILGFSGREGERERGPSFSEAGRSKNPTPIFEKPPPPSSKESLTPHIPSDLRTDLRGRRSKMGSSSIFGAEDRRLKMAGSSFFGSQGRGESVTRSSEPKIEESTGFFENGRGSSKMTGLPKNAGIFEEPPIFEEPAPFFGEPFHLPSSTPKNEEPPVLDLRIRRLDRRSPSASKCLQRIEDNCYERLFERTNKINPL